MFGAAQLVNKVFTTLVRVFLIPASLIGLLAQTFIGYEQAFLGICIINTIITIPMVVVHLLKLLPTMAILRMGAVGRIIVEIILEVSFCVGFWAFYLLKVKS